MRASRDSKWGLWAPVSTSADQGRGRFWPLGREFPPLQLDTAQGPCKVPAPAKCPLCHSPPRKGITLVSPRVCECVSMHARRVLPVTVHTLTHTLHTCRQPQLPAISSVKVPVNSPGMSPLPLCSASAVPELVRRCVCLPVSRASGSGPSPGLRVACLPRAPLGPSPRWPRQPPREDFTHPASETLPPSANVRRPHFPQVVTVPALPCLSHRVTCTSISVRCPGSSPARTHGEETAHRSPWG